MILNLYTNVDVIIIHRKFQLYFNSTSTIVELVKAEKAVGESAGGACTQSRFYLCTNRKLIPRTLSQYNFHSAPSDEGAVSEAD